jgi:hypothetical protein
MGEAVGLTATICPSKLASCPLHRGTLDSATSKSGRAQPDSAGGSSQPTVAAWGREWRWWVGAALLPATGPSRSLDRIPLRLRAHGGWLLCT